MFVYFAIKSNVVFSFVNAQKDNNGLFMFAMIAGFVEMLVPNIMNNLARDARISSEGRAEKVSVVDGVVPAENNDEARQPAPESLGSKDQ
jgi:hypothetical protein